MMRRLVTAKLIFSFYTVLVFAAVLAALLLIPSRSWPAEIHHLLSTLHLARP